MVIILQYRQCIYLPETTVRQDFFNNIRNNLLAPFIDYLKDKNADFLKKSTQLIDDFMAAIVEVTTNVYTHCKDKYHHQCKSSCILQIEFHHNQIIIFCRDFGNGINPAKWEEYKKQTSGLGLMNPVYGSVTDAKLISVKEGTCIKLVKQIPDDLNPFKQPPNLLPPYNCVNHCYCINYCLTA